MSDAPTRRPEDVSAEDVREFQRRTGLDEGDARRLLAGIEAARDMGLLEAHRRAVGGETLREQYARTPDLGQPFPKWAEVMIDDIGAAAADRAYAHDLMVRVMATVGVDQKATHDFLYMTHPVLHLAPVVAIRQRGWRALDALLRTIFAGPTP